MESIVSEVLSRLFLFVLFGIAASMIQEAIAGFVSARSAYLEMGVRALLGDCMLEDGSSFVDRFYHHGFVQSLYFDTPLNPSEKRANEYRYRVRRGLGIRSTGKIAGMYDAFTLPAFVPGKVFSMVVLDILNTSRLDGLSALPAIEKQISRLRDLSKLDNVEIPGTAAALMAMLADSSNEENVLERFRVDLEEWFNRTMDSVTTWYQSYVQRSLILIGLLLAIVFNVDSIRVARMEWMDKDARQAIQQAQDAYLNNVVKSDPELKFFSREELTRLERTASSVRDEVNSNHVPIGWNAPRSYYWHIYMHPEEWNLVHILAQTTGWLITAYAISLFAKIWFDALKKFAPLLSVKS